MKENEIRSLALEVAGAVAGIFLSKKLDEEMPTREISSIVNRIVDGAINNFKSMPQPVVSQGDHQGDHI